MFGLYFKKTVVRWLLQNARHTSTVEAILDSAYFSGKFTVREVRRLGAGVDFDWDWGPGRPSDRQGDSPFLLWLFAKPHSQVSGAPLIWMFRTEDGLWLASRDGRKRDTAELEWADHDKSNPKALEIFDRECAALEAS